MIPKFALTRATKPADLQAGERSIVFEALKPYPEVVSLVELVDRCIKLGFAERKRNSPPLSYLWESVLNQIRALKELGLVREE